MKRKLLAIAMTVVLVGSTFTGCGKAEKKTLLDPKNPTTVTIWNYYNGEQLGAFDKLVNQFNDTVGIEKGIIVESVSQGSIGNLATNLLNAAEGKVGAEDVPSAAAIYAETAFILNRDQAIVPLDSYFTQSELDEYIPKFVDEGRFTSNGELYLLPVSKSTETFIVNTTDWAEFEKATGIAAASVDSYEDLTVAAKAYYDWTDAKTPDIPEDGKALYGRDSIANYIFVGTTQLGHEIFQVQDDGSVNIDMDRNTFKKLWDNYYIPYINGYFVNDASHRSEDMKIGTVIAMTGSTTGVSYIANSVVDEDDQSHEVSVSIEKSLNFDAGKDKVYVQQGAGYCVMKTSDAEQEATVEFLKWFTDTEQNLAFSVNSGYSPVKTAANDVNTIKNSIEADTYKNSNMQKALLVSAQIYTSGETYTCRAFNGSKDVRDILADALENVSVNDRNSVKEKISQGMSKTDAVTEYESDAYFDAWFRKLCDQVNSAVK